jgi:hypothetical protein
MSYSIIPRGKRFWVVRFLSDGTYEPVERYETKADAEEAIETLQSNNKVTRPAKSKVKTR